MIQNPNLLGPIVDLTTAIINQFLNISFCLSLVSDSPLNLPISNSFTYITPREGDSLTNQLLNVSEMGCSDYIVRMRNPSRFMNAFDKINYLGKVRRSDRKVVFLPITEDNFTRANMLNILSMKETSFLPSILLVLPVMDSELCTKYDLVTHNYVGPDHQVDEPRYLDRWNSCSWTFKSNANLFPHDMTNLHGKVLKLACVRTSPFVIIDIDPSVEPSSRDGINIRIVDEFCSWINCSTTIVRSSYIKQRIDKELDLNETGLGVISEVLRDQADLAIAPMSPWYQVYKVSDFSVPYTQIGMTCLVPSPRLLASWELPLRPFSWYLWLALVFTFVLASMVYTIAKGFLSEEAFLSTFGMMLAQPLANGDDSWRIRSVTGWLLLTGLVIDNAYCGGLASVLTVPKYGKSIKTAQDIIDSKIELGTLRTSTMFTILMSSEPMDKQLVSQFKVFNEEHIKKRIRKRDLAFVIRRISSGKIVVDDFITEDLLLDVTLMREDLFFEYYVLMMRKSSPYTQKISQFILQLQASGLIPALETQMTRKYFNYKVQIRLTLINKNAENRVPLNLGHLVGVFILYGVGVTISTILFILEILGKHMYSINRLLCILI